MTRSITKKPDDHAPPLRRLLRGAVALVFWLAVWQAVSLLVHKVLLVPSPLRVAATLADMGRTAAFWHAAGLSLLRVVTGFAAGFAAGALLGVATARWRIADLLLSPLLRTIRAVPVASFIILALVWVGVTALPSFISFLMVAPIVWDNVVQGIRRVDVRLLEMARVYRLSRWTVLRRITAPSVMPYLLAAGTTGMGLAWKSGIAAEIICRPAGSIGDGLQYARNTLETPEVFAWTIAVVVMSLLLERLLVAGTRRFGRRYNAAE